MRKASPWRDEGAGGDPPLIQKDDSSALPKAVRFSCGNNVTHAIAPPDVEFICKVLKYARSSRSRGSLRGTLAKPARYRLRKNVSIAIAPPDVFLTNISMNIRDTRAAHGSGSGSFRVEKIFI